MTDDTMIFDCPVCGRSESLRVHPGHTVLLFTCRLCTGPNYFDELLETVGASGEALIDSPATFLGPPTRVRGSDGPPEPLPTELQVAGWHQSVMRGRTDPLGQYLRSRGLTRKTIRRYEIGWDGDAYTFPVREDGDLVNLVRHRPEWERKRRYMVLRGRGAQLYPDVPRQPGVLLCAGLLDPLMARQHGVPAVSTTCGKQVPKYLAPRFGGRRVAVAFDAGEEPQAALAVEQLVAAGAERAWVVPLPLPAGGDVADWFVKYGRSRTELYKLIRAAQGQRK